VLSVPKECEEMSVLPPTCEHGSALLCTGNAKLRGEGEGKKRRKTDLEAVHSERDAFLTVPPALSFSLFTVRSSGTKKQQNGYAPPLPPPARSFRVGFEEARGGLTGHSHSVLVNNYVEERAKK